MNISFSNQILKLQLLFCLLYSYLYKTGAFVKSFKDNNSAGNYTFEE